MYSILLAICILIMLSTLSLLIKGSGDTKIGRLLRILFFVSFFWVFPWSCPYAGTTEHKTQEETIISLNDNFLIHGSFGFFGGSVTQEAFYSYYLKDRDGVITYKQVKAKDAIIIEEPLEDIGYEHTSYKRKRVDKNWYHQYGWEKQYPVKLIVPEGSVEHSFELNNKV